MTSMILRIRSLLLIGLALSGCAYHAGFIDPCREAYHTISVPFFCEDTEGCLTNAVIRELTRASGYEYRSSGGDLILQGSIIEIRDENIGFSYDLTNKGALTNSIIPTETRLSMVVEVSLIDSCSGKVILGPARLKGITDFDHDYESSRNEINIFSLGQLSDYDAAYDEAFSPLSRVLARKIVDYVNDGW